MFVRWAATTTFLNISPREDIFQIKDGKLADMPPASGRWHRLIPAPAICSSPSMRDGLGDNLPPDYFHRL